jgi:7-carboxy-7-deazaguanine synthase
MELRVTEIFLSIQGESSHAGRPCSFVRLTGCPMRCVWCDSEYTFYGGEKVGFDEIFSTLDEFGCGLVEVTGGEPLSQKNVFPFITELCDRGYEVLVETGGYVLTEQVDPRASIILDVKCPASGEAERNHWLNLERLRPEKDEVKFVIADMQDWEFAKGVIEKHDLEKRSKEILISPVHGIENLSEIAEAVSRSGLKARLNLQIHKFIWGAETRGV